MRQPQAWNHLPKYRQKQSQKYLLILVTEAKHRSADSKQH
jgi:hypothetical protein